MGTWSNARCIFLGPYIHSCGAGRVCVGYLELLAEGVEVDGLLLETSLALVQPAPPAVRLAASTASTIAFWVRTLTVAVSG